MEASCSAAQPTTENREPAQDLNEDEVDIELTFSVYAMSGEAFKIEMKSKERVRLLKRKIEEISGTPHEDVRIVGGTEVLSNRQTMAQVKALHGDCLQLITMPAMIEAREVTMSHEGAYENGVVLLTESTTYEPTEDEVDDYSEWLGMDLDKDQDYMWIAREGLKCQLSHPWRACSTPEGDVFYFNFETLESTWEHPRDQHYKQLFRRLKQMKQSMPPAGRLRPKGLNWLKRRRKPSATDDNQEGPAPTDTDDKQEGRATPKFGFRRTPTPIPQRGAFTDDPEERMSFEMLSGEGGTTITGEENRNDLEV
eukprot:gnl/TRDRNA2_/TRDRNA2_160114_c0_seq1.p1 gnl/TRDRNA2_/TRDRNA2_160114_c0~~gnl/TRDRNA2_/TRDRNA2_160114_c0_seq1.p1  ORF type:complete len:310 (-),score=65.92 gnl/TRDRNA2_/TRDRNA2_160114_c0_seq1:227-1156(-)